MVREREKMINEKGEPEEGYLFTEDSVCLQPAWIGRISATSYGEGRLQIPTQAEKEDDEVKNKDIKQEGGGEVRLTPRTIIFSPLHGIDVSQLSSQLVHDWMIH